MNTLSAINPDEIISILKEEIEIYAKNWEEKHLDRLKQEDKIIVEKRIK